MIRKFLVAVAAFSAFAANAAVIGPVYPASQVGGNTFASNSVSFVDTSPTLRIGTYTFTAFDGSGLVYPQLFWGSSGNQSFGVSMDGLPISGDEWMQLDAASITLGSNNVAVFKGSTELWNGSGVETRMTITLEDGAGDPITWQTGAFIGRPDTAIVGQVYNAGADVGSFRYSATVEARAEGSNGGWQSLADFFAANNGSNNGTLTNQLQSSFSFGFFYEPAAAGVPAPGALALLAFGLLGFGLRRKAA